MSRRELVATLRKGAKVSKHTRSLGMTRFPVKSSGQLSQTRNKPGACPDLHLRHHTRWAPPVPRDGAQNPCMMLRFPSGDLALMRAAGVPGHAPKPALHGPPACRWEWLSLQAIASRNLRPPKVGPVFHVGARVGHRESLFMVGRIRAGFPFWSAGRYLRRPWAGHSKAASEAGCRGSSQRL